MHIFPIPFYTTAHPLQSSISKVCFLSENRVHNVVTGYLTHKTPTITIFASIPYRLYSRVDVYTYIYIFNTYTQFIHVYIIYIHPRHARQPFATTRFARITRFPLMSFKSSFPTMEMKFRLPPLRANIRPKTQYPTTNTELVCVQHFNIS